MTKPLFKREEDGLSSMSINGYIVNMIIRDIYLIIGNLLVPLYFGGLIYLYKTGKNLGGFSGITELTTIPAIILSVVLPILTVRQLIQGSKNVIWLLITGIICLGTAIWVLKSIFGE